LSAAGAVSDCAYSARFDEIAICLSYEFSRCRGELTQLGRSARLGPGDLVIYDSGGTFDYSSRAKTQLLKIPRRLLESKLDRPSDFLALKIDRSNPLSTMLGELLTRCLDIDLSLDLVESPLFGGDRRNSLKINEAVSQQAATRKWPPSRLAISLRY
jgi:hypothetical protein